MPTLRLVPKKAVLQLQAGDPTAEIERVLKETERALNKKTTDEAVFEPVFTENVAYSVVQESLMRRVRLTSEEEFSKLDGYVSLKRSEGKNTDKPVGLLSYIPKFESEDGLLSEPSSYHVVCDLPTRQFDELVLAARHSRIPSSIVVDVVGEGAELGWEPDGSGFDWNNKEHPHVPIAGIGFSIPLVLSSDLDEYDEDSETIASTSPVSHSQVEQLIQRVDSLRNDLRTLLGVVVFATILLFIQFAW